jgi:adenine-specific DNA-methyltransferase
MASLFDAHWRDVELLDAGPGAGALTAALARRLCAERHKPRRISITAFELDSALLKQLKITLSQCRQDCERASVSFSATVRNEDFIAATVPIVWGDLFATQLPRFNAAIVNPPNGKIRSDSLARLFCVLTRLLRGWGNIRHKGVTPALS